MSGRWFKVLVSVLLSVARVGEALNRWIGERVAWLALGMVAIVATVAVLRYWFGLGWIALQESASYLHALLFMLTAGYALQRNAHVRVDIFYQRCSPRARAWIDLFGTLLLLVPVCLVMLWMSWDYVAHAWAIQERSPETGGLPGVWLLKTLLLALPVLLLLQGCAVVIRNALFLAGSADMNTAPEE